MIQSKKVLILVLIKIISCTYPKKLAICKALHIRCVWKGSEYVFDIFYTLEICILEP